MGQKIGPIKSLIFQSHKVKCDAQNLTLMIYNILYYPLHIVYITTYYSNN